MPSYKSRQIHVTNSCDKFCDQSNRKRKWLKTGPYFIIIDILKWLWFTNSYNQSGCLDFLNFQQYIFQTKDQQLMPVLLSCQALFNHTLDFI